MDKEQQRIKRIEDMGVGSLELLKQDDGDIIIIVTGHSEITGRLNREAVEFCTPGTGGGASQKTWEALHNLFDAMKQDNEGPQQFGGRAEHLIKKTP